MAFERKKFMGMCQNLAGFRGSGARVPGGRERIAKTEGKDLGTETEESPRANGGCQGARWERGGAASTDRNPRRGRKGPD